MNYREIDRLVAEKVMGWQVIEYKNIGKTVIDDGEFPVEIEEFKPSERIEDAWKVVEKLKDKYWVEINAGINDYLCDVGEYGVPHSTLQVLAVTAPLAICKAALKTAGIEVQPCTKE